MEGYYMRQLIKKVIVVSVLTMAVAGGVASAANCTTTCIQKREACMAATGDPDYCIAMFKVCMESCGA